MPGVSSTTFGSREPTRRDVLQHLEQPLGIVFDRQDRQAVEDLRKRALHHLAVFEHVRHARRAAQIVFEHVELAVAVADQVGAGDVAPDAARRLRPAHGRRKHLPDVDQPVGNDPVVQDLACRCRCRR